MRMTGGKSSREFQIAVSVWYVYNAVHMTHTYTHIHTHTQRER